MVKRIFNFAAGPCILPVPVLEDAQKEFVEYQDSGMSIIEMSHRGKHVGAMHEKTLSLLRELLAVPEDYEVLFLGGGATLQFSMIWAPPARAPLARACVVSVGLVWPSLGRNTAPTRSSTFSRG